MQVPSFGQSRQINSLSRVLGLIVLSLIGISIISACTDSGYYEYEPGFENEYYEPEFDEFSDELYYESEENFFDDSPYDGYDDGYDQDCFEVGEEVWVGDYDPDGLDADGDGWGCETWE